MKKKELLKQIDDMIFYEDSLTEEARELYSNMFSEISFSKQREFAMIRKSSLIEGYVKTIVQWSTYLKYFEDEEEFEICAKIQRIINIEEREFKKVFLAIKCTSEEQKEYYTKIIDVVKNEAKLQVIDGKN